MLGLALGPRTPPPVFGVLGVRTRRGFGVRMGHSHRVGPPLRHPGTLLRSCCFSIFFSKTSGARVQMMSPVWPLQEAGGCVFVSHTGSVTTVFFFFFFCHILYHCKVGAGQIRSKIGKSPREPPAPGSPHVCALCRAVPPWMLALARGDVARARAWPL